jgi:4-diphosphocytidyl-2-C-methyl-D-erythritol kinase
VQNSKFSWRRRGFGYLFGPVTQKKNNGTVWRKQKAPAKVNLMLSVQGLRPDGFHDLTSLVAPLEFGDELELRLNGGGSDSLAVEGWPVPLDGSNLVLKAARAFRERSGRAETFDFRLKKRIPPGAGLGGGSSDAVAALKGMDAIAGTGLGCDGLREIAACVGSDCPFFVDAEPALMRGRGERLERLDGAMSERLFGQRLLLFQPGFGVATGWAYRQLAARPENYEPATLAEARLAAYRDGGELSALMRNGFEPVVSRKFLALSCLLEILRNRGFCCMMSGSGSACFALAEDRAQTAEMARIVSDCWGESTFWVETSVTGKKMG